MKENGLAENGLAAISQGRSAGCRGIAPRPARERISQEPRRRQRIFEPGREDGGRDAVDPGPWMLANRRFAISPPEQKP